MRAQPLQEVPSRLSFFRNKYLLLFMSTLFSSAIHSLSMNVLHEITPYIYTVMQSDGSTIGLSDRLLPSGLWLYKIWVYTRMLIRDLITECWWVCLGVAIDRDILYMLIWDLVTGCLMGTFRLSKIEVQVHICDLVTGYWWARFGYTESRYMY